MSRLLQIRSQESKRLKEELHAAIKRLQEFRATHPDSHHLELACYPDGSIRSEVDWDGGFDSPSHHLWTVGHAHGLTVRICELVDREIWRQEPWNARTTDIDIGKYVLATSDPTRVRRYDRGPYIQTVPDASITKDLEWSIDTIISIAEVLRNFCTTKNPLLINGRVPSSVS